VALTPTPAPTYAPDPATQAALDAFGRRDGAACLAALPAAARTDAKHPMASVHAYCTMLAGDCDKGKVLARAALGHQWATSMPAEAVERSVEGLVGLYCTRPTDPRDIVARAQYRLSQGAYMGKVPVRECEAAYADLVAAAPKVKPRDPWDTSFKPETVQAIRFVTAPHCFERAGDCARAWAVFQREFPAQNLAAITDKAQRAQALADAFDGAMVVCKAPRGR
jgi:hypothetical protein